MKEEVIRVIEIPFGVMSALDIEQAINKKLKNLKTSWDEVEVFKITEPNRYNPRMFIFFKCIQKVVKQKATATRKPKKKEA